MTPAPAKTGSGFLMVLAVVVIIVLVGRLFDHVLVGYRVAPILCSLILLASLVGGALPVLRTRVGFPHVALFAWMCLSVLFSSWRGGSADYMMPYVIVAFMWLSLAAGPRHLGDVRKLLYLVIALYLGLLVFGVDMSAAEESRLEAGKGTHGNSEDIAMIAGFLLPLCLYVSSLIKFAPLRWVLIIASFLFTVRTVALTGSRAGTVALIVMALFSLYRMSGVKRLLIVVAAATGLLFVIVSVPGHLLTRLATISDALGGSSDEGDSTEAAESARERKAVLRDSIRITFENPIFGIGLGQFADYRWSSAKKEGGYKAAVVTHNTFTQISSESGLPALFFYIVMLYGIYKTLRRGRELNASSDPESENARFLVWCLELSFIYFLVCAVFVSMVLYVPQFVIAGLALAIERVSASRVAAAGPPPAPAPRPGLIAGGAKFDGSRAPAALPSRTVRHRM